MKTVATLSLLAASASAFAPAKNAARSSALSMAFENELGVQPPVRLVTSVHHRLVSLYVEAFFFVKFLPAGK